MTTSAVIIQTLQDKIHALLAPHMPSGGKLALLDFPDHPNVGDSAIWLGEIAYLKRWHRTTPRYVCTVENFRHEDLRAALPTGPIFLHGGGNFGDVWPKHQDFREMIIKEYPDRPIIQLPQSIHFSDEASIARTAAIINAHPNFTLLVRDQHSYDLAKKHFTCKTELSPDMAFCLGAQTRHGPLLHKLLLLLRTDHETQTAAPPANDLPPGASVEDWLEEDPHINGRIRKLTKRYLPLLGLKALVRDYQREMLYRFLAEDRVTRGLRQLSSAPYVITDRLHAHILCLLLNIPHTVLDNNYGKIRRFSEVWTQDLGILSRAQTLPEAINTYKSMMAPKA